MGKKGVIMCSLLSIFKNFKKFDLPYEKFWNPHKGIHKIFDIAHDSVLILITQ